ncbi:DUF1428 domain-containing protein [Frigidibacter sp. MR17.14]|uniref:DUF1428 domain-containing protein n=1 Tax=Frigidibacter sp. MR17.14 TaxID=3126509 RepID=UPI003012ACED
MGYVDGFVVPVPESNREAYRRHAEAAAPVFRRGGMTRFLECWGDDVPEGKRTDFRRAVQAVPGEQVLFSWIEFPDRATRDASHRITMESPEAEAMMRDMPFDGKRMIWAGFEVVSDAGPGGTAGYVDGMVAPAPSDGRGAFAAAAGRMAPLFLGAGATRVVDCWGDVVPEGKVTDFQRAVAAGADETAVYSWIEWPSKAVRDAGWAQLMAGGAMPGPDEMPFCPQRMIHGGFAPIVQV